MIYERFLWPASLYLYFLLLGIIGWSYIRYSKVRKISLDMNSSGRLKEQAFLIQIFTVLPLPLSSLTSVAIMDLFPEYVVAGMGFHFVVWGLLILLMLKTLSYLPRFLRIFIVVGTVCILLSIFFSGMVPETGIKKAMLLIVSVFPGFLASVMLVQLSLIQCYTDN